MPTDEQCQALGDSTARRRAPVIESLEMWKKPFPSRNPFQPKEPFQSLEEQTAFESKMETARKWIREAACSMGYQRSAVSINATGAVSLRLTIEHPALGGEYEVDFNRRLIEGIADGEVSVREQAIGMIESIVPRRV